MSILVSCQSIAKSFGIRTLFQDLTLGFSEGERLGLIGPNGSGKSTLLKIFAGLEPQDEGKIFVKKGIRLVFLAQTEEIDAALSVEEVLLQGLSGSPMPESERFMKVHRMLSQCGFQDPKQTAANLSGGWMKRLAIARALVQEPDLLLMDEPTNHLDMEGILWLESVLNNATFAFVLISHDRYFLDRVTNRIIELSRQYRDGFLRVEGNYRDFLRRKSELLESQARQESSLSSKLRREMEWLARGPKARTTKARFRIDEAGRLKEEFQEVKGRNTLNRKIGISFSDTSRKTKKLLDGKNLGKSFGDRTIFTDLDIRLSPGLCIGILGPNGVGKTTLMSILADRLQPDSGTIKRADGLKVVMFDQKRQDLDPSQSLRRALAPEGDSVVYKGRSLHVVSWAKRFLFAPEQLDMEVGRLSGGEQARILIARLMLQKADVLLLDEPTNDLDIQSLEVLEEGLEEFGGAVVLVSHDRFLLDKLADYVLGFDGLGNCTAYGDFNQWIKDRLQQARSSKEKTKKSKKVEKPAAKATNKLTFTEKNELAGMEERISAAEEELAQWQERVQEPEVLADPAVLRQCCQSLEEAQTTVDTLYARWEELESKDGM